jgi:hypothetical protein
MMSNGHVGPARMFSPPKCSNKFSVRLKGEVVSCPAGAQQFPIGLKDPCSANLKAVVALYFWSYNFCLIHGSLRMTPAMAAGITDHIWSLSELV